MKISSRPWNYESSNSNSLIATEVEDHGCKMQVSPSRSEASLEYVSVWLTASGKLSRGMQKHQHYTLEVQLEPEEIVRAFIALPPQILPEAIAKVLLDCKFKRRLIEEFREVQDRHEEGLVTKSDLVETLHAMVDALSGLADVNDD